MLPVVDRPANERFVLARRQFVGRIRADNPSFCQVADRKAASPVLYTEPETVRFCLAARGKPWLFVPPILHSFWDERMGRSLTAVECLQQAQEYLILAERTSDADLRNQYLRLSKELSQLATILDTEPKAVIDDGIPDARPVRSKRGRSKEEPR